MKGGWALALAGAGADGRWTLGRGAGCDVLLNGQGVSQEHLLLELESGAWYATDLGSTNGSFADERRLPPRQRVPLEAVAILRLGSMTLTGAAVAMGRQASTADTEQAGPAITVPRLVAHGVSVTVDGRHQLLRGVDLAVLPGELVMLLGPSGAGKSTLMQVLSGQREPQQGLVAVDGFAVYPDPVRLADRLGHVPQQPVMLRTLSVRQVLHHAAAVRLPPGQVSGRVSSVLKAVELEEQAGLRVGKEHERGGLSGGQLKRLNLGIELLSDPAVLLLDEPCSGLDARGALEVTHLARRLADQGKAVLMTVHQPRVEALALADRVLILSRGRVVWFGPVDRHLLRLCRATASDRVPHPAATPTDQALDALVTGDPEEDEQRALQWQDRYSRSPAHSELRRRLAAAESPERPPPLRRSRAHQLSSLTRRAVNALRTSPSDLAMLLLQAPALGVLLVVLFGEQRFAWLALSGVPLRPQDQVSPALFMMAAAMLWLGCNNSVRELVRERALFLRERRQGLSRGAYLGSKVLVQALVVSAQAMVLGAAAAVMGMPHRLELVAVLTLVGWAGAALGLAVSAWVRSEYAAVLMVPLVVLPQIMLGGLVQPVADLPELLAWTARWFVPLHQAFDALACLMLPERLGGPGRLQALGLGGGPWNAPLPWVALWSALPLGLAMLGLRRER